MIPLVAVAILLATRNGAQYLRQQVDSLAGQTGVALTVFCRDDASSDNTVALLAEVCATHGLALRMIEDGLGPSGSAGANFMAIARAVRGEPFDHFAFCDQDDIWLPDKLMRAVARLADEKAAGYSSNLLAFDDRTGRQWIVAKDQPQRRWDYLFQGASAGCTYVLTREALHACVDAIPPGPFPAWLSHDWFVYAACRARGLPWVIDDAACILYRQHGGNVFGAKPGWRGVFERYRFARSGWYRRHIAWLAQVLPLSPDAARLARAAVRLGARDRILLSRSLRELRRRPRERVMLALMIASGLL